MQAKTTAHPARRKQLVMLFPSRALLRNTLLGNE